VSRREIDVRILEQIVAPILTIKIGIGDVPFPIKGKNFRLSWDEPEPEPHQCDELKSYGKHIVNIDGNWYLKRVVVYSGPDILCSAIRCPCCDWTVPE